MPKIIERVSASRDKSVRSVRSVWHNQYLAQPLLPAKAYFCDFCDLTLLTSVTTRQTESELSSALAAPEVLCDSYHFSARQRLFLWFLWDLCDLLSLLTPWDKLRFMWYYKSFCDIWDICETEKKSARHSFNSRNLEHQSVNSND